MSDSDSFIDEVTEEVRRDRYFGYLRRYGWIAGLLVLGVVGGAAWTEYTKTQTRGKAEALGDAMLAALAYNDAGARVAALSEIDGGDGPASAVLGFMTATEEVNAEQIDAAVTRLNAIAVDSAVPEIYRQLASFKALVLQADTLDANARRQQLEALAQPGQPFRLLAQEQLALVDISEGDTEAALTRLNAILRDAELTSDLQQRSIQVIVALGGTPDVIDVVDPVN
ncbi:MAG: hypothetical protein WBC93_20570 [Sulfitobacter sp.]